MPSNFFPRRTNNKISFAELLLGHIIIPMSPAGRFKGRRGEFGQESGVVMDSLGGFLDLQVNGYVGVDFHSDALTADELHSVCAALERDRVSGMLATTTTEH